MHRSILLSSEVVGTLFAITESFVLRGSSMSFVKVVANKILVNNEISFHKIIYSMSYPS